MELIGPFDMKLDFDVGLEAAGGLVAGGKRNVLSGKDSDCEMKCFARDSVDDFLVVAVGSVA